MTLYATCMKTQDSLANAWRDVSISVCIKRIVNVVIHILILVNTTSFGSNIHVFRIHSAIWCIPRVRNVVPKRMFARPLSESNAFLLNNGHDIHLNEIKFKT